MSICVVARWLVVFLGVSLALAILSSRVEANISNSCDSYDRFLKVLAEDFAEYPVVRGYRRNIPAFIEILVSKKNTWTILVVDPKENQACLLSWGDSWEALKPPAERNDLKPKIEMDEEPAKEIAA